MRAFMRLAILSVALTAPALCPAAAQYNPPPAGPSYNAPPPGPQYAPPPGPQYSPPPAPQYNPPTGGAPYNPPPRHRDKTFSSDELIREGHRFFGTVSRGLAEIVEKAVSQWGQPNGYVLGQEGSGAFVVGLRYGDGKLYTKNAGDRRVFWEGPSVGFDAGGEGARTMMLIYNLPATDAIYQRFVGIDGSAYFIGGFGMTALASGHVIVVPIRSGVGLRLGANLGYLKFTSRATWNPF